MHKRQTSNQLDAFQCRDIDKTGKRTLMGACALGPLSNGEYVFDQCAADQPLPPARRADITQSPELARRRLRHA
jgi:hypothetical protein